MPGGAGPTGKTITRRSLFMTFAEQLNRYMEESNCSGAKLAEKSGISMAGISRYRNGISLPGIDSERLRRLADGLAQAAAEEGTGIQNPDVLYHQLSEAVHAATVTFDYERFRQNLDTLLQAMAISLTDLARFASYDVSYLSRVLSGQRRPRDPVYLAQSLARFVSARPLTLADRVKLAMIVGCKAQDLENQTECAERLSFWIVSGRNGGDDGMSELIFGVDSFDPAEFVRASWPTNLDDLGDAPRLSGRKEYEGKRGLEESELAFLRISARSVSDKSLLIYDDIPTDEVHDAAFKKKRRECLIALLRQGVRIDLIRSIDRSFRDIIAELEAWIPLYMSGRVYTHYVDVPQNSPFHQILLVNNGLALRGEVIGDNMDNGHFSLTRNKRELDYFRKWAPCC